jgi:hypothetical protein
MEENAFIVSIAAGTFYLIASLRLFRLSRRNGERPELLLGFYFGLSGAYYVAYNLPSLLGFGPWPSTAEWTIEWIYVLGVFPYLFFIRSVFRPENVWAGAFVGVCSILLLGGTVLGALDGRAVYSLENPWFLVGWAGYTLPCAWMGCEAMLSRHGARKRSRLGLCAPIVANRYLLLALFGGFQVLACLADLSYAADISSHQAASLISEVLLGGTEIASIAVLWLAFFPPSFYSEWITRRAVILPTPMDG